jgi:hypothetical protein
MAGELSAIVTLLRVTLLPLRVNRPPPPVPAIDV